MARILLIDDDVTTVNYPPLKREACEGKVQA
jgi:hypothetical protein